MFPVIVRMANRAGRRLTTMVTGSTIATPTSTPQVSGHTGRRQRAG
jgi:hypothetical protein